MSAFGQESADEGVEDEVGLVSGRARVRSAGDVLLAAGHTVVGYRWVLARLREEGLPSTSFGDSATTAAAVTVTWDFVTLAATRAVWLGRRRPRKLARRPMWVAFIVVAVLCATSG